MFFKKKIMLCTILVSLLIIEGGLAVTPKISQKRLAQGETQGSVKEKNSATDQTTPFIIKNEISYSYNFDADDKNFEPNLLSVKGKTTRDYTVLVNIHNGSELNTSSEFDPKKRTLSWGTPYEAALSQAMSALKHPHEQSALLTSWTGNKLRTFISFVIIPKGTQMEFKIGYAASQRSTNPGIAQEFRLGGGMQIRLKYLPAGTIVLSEPLTTQSKVHGRVTYSLYKLFNQAIDDFNKAELGNKLPPAISEAHIAFIGAEEYVQESFETVKQ